MIKFIGFLRSLYTKETGCFFTRATSQSLGLHETLATAAIAMRNSQSVFLIADTRLGRNIMKKVVKFGGSSLASAAQFEKVGKIIRAEDSRRYVVPSAPGKRFSSDTKKKRIFPKIWHRSKPDIRRSLMVSL